MKISKRDWFFFGLAAFLLLFLWRQIEYPLFSSVNLAINKQKASFLAKNYLQKSGIDAGTYTKTITFETDSWTDRYLQRTVGIKGEEKFVKDHSYNIFFWQVRFFKELQKEEFIVRVDPKAGAVVEFLHLIEDTEPRQEIGKELARKKAEAFLENNFNINLDTYDFHEEKITRFEKRTDYGFSWEKKGVYIPWKEKEGGAKLLTGVTISGDEIRVFYKNRLDVPDKFERFVQNQLIFGEYLYSFYFVFLIGLFAVSISILLRKRSTLILRLTKNWFYFLGFFVVTINIIDVFNNAPEIYMAYPTSAKFSSFLGLYFVRTSIAIVFSAFSFVIPGLAGESLASEVFSSNRYASFLHYLKSSFLSRKIAKAIILGYLTCMIMLGIQSISFYLGQKYFGVWRELQSLTQFSTAYLPIFSAFVIGVSASLSEEVTFRLFGISWTKKYLKNIFLGILITSLFWGLGHSTYPVFPVGFRIFEIGVLGIFLGFIFIRYGIIPVIIAHYLFDVFWGSAAFVIGKSSTGLFLGSIFVLAIPMIIAIIAFLMNKSDEEREITQLLDKIQEYNLNILITFISARKSQGIEAVSIKNGLLEHNWDISLVDLAIKEVFKN